MLLQLLIVLKVKSRLAYIQDDFFNLSTELSDGLIQCVKLGDHDTLKDYETKAITRSVHTDAG